ncbi:nucleoside/nucleotide kinase family protein [Defluviimonas sp. WL0002]|uniref:Nucleoside/nucleotide kinase family protein n=1 Tax=Albidovulum marisflavi TaxID=2984159 RepID=A0ABT2Z7S4_9RHOB|nr:nucleoside/nucleotide kinase family protein [Defluviimonas sp. WL0002]MCV2867082.1 nucleoside/nucleotide kinase family protein [Defluviimonas sp. WL0002]
MRIAELIGQPGAHRRIIAIAGPPGSGKSTLASRVVDDLLAAGVAAALMPMDGFHLDDRLLEPRGLLRRKGAPETFDFPGFASALRRVRDEPSVVLPVFDRNREIAIAGAAEIQPDTRLVVVEGNYLALDEDPWRQLAPLWDLCIFLDVPMAELERRLVARWLSFGFEPEVAHARAAGNDLPNAERICRAVGRVDLLVHVGRPSE